MSVEARIAKLESLLGRVQSRRKSPDELGAAPEPLEPSDEPVRAVSPTPMEAALDSVAFEAPDDEPEVEIVMDADDDDEPIITVLPPGGDLSEPELLLDETPTAPVDTRAPVQAQPPSSPSVPERIAASPAQPSGPVAKVVSQARPRTFGELLDRTLALRPR